VELALIIRGDTLKYEKNNWISTHRGKHFTIQGLTPFTLLTTNYARISGPAVRISVWSN